MHEKCLAWGLPELSVCYHLLHHLLSMLSPPSSPEVSTLFLQKARQGVFSALWAMWSQSQLFNLAVLAQKQPQIIGT